MALFRTNNAITAKSANTIFAKATSVPTTKSLLKRPRAFCSILWRKTLFVCSDKWEAFAKVLLSERHVIGKEHTNGIVRDNSNTLLHVERVTRQTKVVSKCKQRVDYSLRIWYAVTTTELFKILQEK